MEPHRILLTAGSNAKGQLGIGSYDDGHIFTPCQFAGCEPNQLPDPNSRVTDVACGANHTVLLLRHLDGSTTLWGAGDGRRGQLGPAYTHEEPERAPWTIFHQLVLPLRFDSESAAGASYVSRGYTCKHVAAAWETTYVVLSHPDNSDVLLSMGSNEFGALGVGEGAGAGVGVGVGVTRSGSVRTRTAGGGPVGEPQVVDFDHLFTDVSGRHTQPKTVCVRSLHAGPRHVVAQLFAARAAIDGSSSYSQTLLVGWGASRHGQLGQNGRARCIARPTRLPISIEDDPVVSCALGNQHTVVLHESGGISALGSNKQGQIPPPGSRERFCGLGCTWNGTYMQAIDKHVLLSRGNNAQGQLGRGYTGQSASTVDESVDLPVDHAMTSFVCGSEHVLATMSSPSQEGNSVVGWGWNEHGNMGLGSLGNVATPTRLWPREDVEAYKRYPQRVIDIWAGCATSWLLVE